MAENLKKESSAIFSWSPLLGRKKQLDFTQRNKIDGKADKERNYYPNCDFRIWLRSCEKEVPELLPGEVFGEIPSWLNGSLLRNGPGTLKAGEDEFQHLFDSSALIHRFAIDQGKVSYQCKFLKTEIYKKIWTANRLVMTEFGTKAVPDPCQTIFQRIKTMFSLKSDMSDNAMISLYPFGDQIYAFGEMPYIHRVDLDTLDTLDRVDVSEHVNIVNHTSHPHIMDDGSVYNVGLSLYPSGPYHSVMSFPKGEFERATIVASIPTRWPLNPSYMHTFGITPNYFVILEQPLCVSLPTLVSLKFQNDPLAGAFKWFEDQFTQFTVISRETSAIVKKFQADPFFFLHIINQYEDSGHVVIDVCAYRDPSMLDCMYVETLRNMQSNPDYAKMFRGRPIRFALPLHPDLSNDNLVTLPYTRATAKYAENGKIHVKAEKLCEIGCETPRIYYEKYLGKPYRYFYAISSDVDAPNTGTLIKVDVRTKSCKTWQGNGCFPSEPIFVPSPTGEMVSSESTLNIRKKGGLYKEDEGILLSALVWGSDDENRAGLLILDAITMREIGRAEFRTPSPVPKCLHGWFFPQQ